jgi:hypothetical protein
MSASECIPKVDGNWCSVGHKERCQDLDDLVHPVAGPQLVEDLPRAAARSSVPGELFAELALGPQDTLRRFTFLDLR